jgi:hypothetical protein
MRPWFSRMLPLFVVAAAAALWGVLMVRLFIARERTDDLRDTITYVVFGWDEQTTYSNGFTERRFRELRNGMNVSEVLKHVGPPLSTYPDHDGGGRVFYYSSGQRDGDYWLRYVVVDSSGVVTEVARVFYWD